MANLQVTERFQQQYETRKPQLPGGVQVRDQAIAELVAGGLPDRKTERWRYTRLNSVFKQEFVPAIAPVSVTGANHALPALSTLLAACDTPVLVFHQGFFQPELSRLDGLGQIKFQPLGAALASGELQLPAASGGRDRAFDQLNTALVADGAWLKIPAGKHPLITLVVLAATDENAEQANYWRLVVEAASQSESQIAVVYGDQGADQAYHSNNYIDVNLAPGAHLSISQLQQQGDQAFHVASLRANLLRDSVFKTHVLTLGGGISRDDLDITLADTGAHVEVDGLQLTDGRQHADLHLNLDHAAPHCTSQVNHHGLFGGRGRGVFNGRVHVLPGADGTDSRMSSKNLLLSDKAEIDTKPELEIYADDVKCSHGATVGDLNRDELFYLRSRGLAEADARALLLNAFAAASFASLDGAWGEYVGQGVAEKMDQLSQQGDHL